MADDPISISLDYEVWKHVISAADCGLMDLDPEFNGPTTKALDAIERALRDARDTQTKGTNA